MENLKERSARRIVVVVKSNKGVSRSFTKNTKLCFDCSIVTKPTQAQALTHKESFFLEGEAVKSEAIGRREGIHALEPGKCSISAHRKAGKPRSN